MRESSQRTEFEVIAGQIHTLANQKAKNAPLICASNTQTNVDRELNTLLLKRAMDTQPCIQNISTQLVTVPCNRSLTDEIGL